LKADVKALTDATALAQESLRKGVTDSLETLRKDNETKLEAMRATVEEKLQGTLEKRLGESFAIVSERLEKVHQGLGEMQTLAIGVGDLKRVMSNVKDRGGWAEIQLGVMLDQMLARDQYETNAKVDASTGEIVEFAVRMPGQASGGDVLLPIDAKFPKEDYERLVLAWESGNADAARAAAEALSAVFETEAKRISSKYIRPPVTTDFAVMYVPTEGLFAEAMRAPGLAQRLQSKYRVTVAGPTTLHALLNSLQMGFRTLAIQKRSGEVWRVLSEAKAEFQKYGDVWDRLSRQLQTAQNTIEEAGRRTRAVERKLKDVEIGDGSFAPLAQVEEAVAEVG
jgi:DNA recombination protein RmuC